MKIIGYLLAIGFLFTILSADYSPAKAAGNDDVFKGPTKNIGSSTTPKRRL